MLWRKDDKEPTMSPIRRPIIDFDIREGTLDDKEWISYVLKPEHYHDFEVAYWKRDNDNETHIHKRVSPEQMQTVIDFPEQKE